ncbi:MAG: hypothetical protein OEM46_07740 [Ignavibacteria bacterium]|nr:hypothetical protein [Ignavibacteria bacterium]
MSKLQNSVNDVKIAGSFLKSSGSTIVLSIVCLALVVLLGVEKYNNSKTIEAIKEGISVGADRWTGEDQQAFDDEVQLKWKDHILIHSKLTEDIKRTHDDVILIKRDLEYIAKVLTKIEENGR